MRTQKAEGQVAAARADYTLGTRQMADRKKNAQKALALDIPGARPTATGLLLCLLYLGGPVLVLGNLVDLLFQMVFGWCIGLWCVF